MWSLLIHSIIPTTVYNFYNVIHINSGYYNDYIKHLLRKPLNNNRKRGWIASKWWAAENDVLCFPLLIKPKCLSDIIIWSSLTLNTWCSSTSIIYFLPSHDDINKYLNDVLLVIIIEHKSLQNLTPLFAPWLFMAHRAKEHQ